MAQQDDSAYNSNPYGMQDPTALFQDLTQKNAQNFQTGGMAQGNMVAGGNPEMSKAQYVQSRMGQILQDVGPAGKDEDPLDYQMRQARAVSSGFARSDPITSIQADQQMIKLENAKKQQALLTEETRQRGALATELEQKNASDPMVWTQAGKDNVQGMMIPTITQVGKPISRTDEKGNPRTGWSSDLTDELKANGGFQPGMMAMPQSQFLAQQTKLNEGRNVVMANTAFLRYSGMVDSARIRAVATQGTPLDAQTVHVAAIETAYDPKTISLYAAGQGGNQRKGDIANERTRWMAENGIEAEDLAGWRANIHAAAKTQGVMQTNLAQLSVAEQLLTFNGNRVMALVQDVDATGIPAVEGLRRHLITVGGYSSDQINQKVNELNAAMVAYRAETARVISGNPNMTGVLSDTARHEIEAVARENMDAPSMINNIKRSMAEVEFKKFGYINEMKALTGTMRATAGRQQPASLEAPSASAGAGQTIRETPAASSSEPTIHVIGPDGKGGTIPKSQLEAAKAAGYKEG